MLNRLKELLSAVLPGTDLSGVTEQTRLKEELGFDSLAMMMLAMEIEDALGVEFSELVTFETVGDVCSYIENHS